MPSRLTGLAIVAGLATVALLLAGLVLYDAPEEPPASSDPDEAMGAAEEDDPLCQGGLPHPSEPVPPSGAPDTLPGDWARGSVTPSGDPTLADDWPGFLADYRTDFISEHEWLHYHGYTFSSNETATSFFEHLIDQVPGTSWDPGLGNSSVAWFDEEESVHVVFEDDGFVLHLEESSRIPVEERRSEPTAGPFPAVSLEASNTWLEGFRAIDC